MTLDGTNRAYWVQLEREPRPQGSSLRMLYHDLNDDLHALSWDGSSWLAETSGGAISTNVDRGTASHDVEAFGLATFPLLAGASGATIVAAAEDTTAVRLVSFEATGGDSAVEVSWETGSEVDHLGFHLYRALSATGPWERLTSSLMGEVGGAPSGASYSYIDTGLVNGTRYFYRLEDVDTASVSTFHGPVSAVPRRASWSGARAGDPGTPAPGS